MRAFWSHPQTHAAISQSRSHSEAPVCRSNGHNELPLKCFTQHNVDKWINAAVGVAQADCNVVGVQKGKGGPLYSQVGQLQNVVRGPADEERQAYSDRHTGHLSGPHPQVALGQGCNCGGHVLEDLEEDATDDDPRQSKGQEELVEGEPVCVCGRVGQQEGAADRAILQSHESSVHPDRSDGDQREHPDQSHRRPGHKGGSDMFEADWMDGGQVAIQSHHSQDVCAHNLAVGVERGDDGAHGAAEAPGAVAHELVDEERHAEEEEEVCDGQAEDEDVWDCLLRGAELGFLHDGVDYDTVPKDPDETDDTEDARHEQAFVLVMFW